MKKTKEAAQAAQANQSATEQVTTEQATEQVTTEQATEQVTTEQAGAKYLERMHVNKDLCTKSPKIAYKAIRDYSAIPSDLLELAVDSASFSSFIQYMKDRHGIAQDDKTTSPKKGWSIWYSLQWAEKQVKQAANDPTHAAHAKAVEYLRKNRAELQNVTNKDIF